MILIITPENRQKYAGYLEDMHRMRHDVFVDRAGWSELESPFKLEIDEYDTPWTTYYIKLSEKGNVMAGIRTIPTVYKSMLANFYYPKFPDLFDPEALPADPLVWEMSRYFVVDPEYKTQSGHAAKMELYVGMFEHALEQGAKALCGVTESYIIARALRLGWSVNPLSMPFEYSAPDFEGSMTAIKMDVNADMVASTRDAWKLSHQVRPEAINEIAPKPAHFRASDYVLLKEFAEKRPDSMNDFHKMIKMLSSPDSSQRNLAEGYLDRWIEEALSEGLMFDGNVSPSSTSVN
ncbi:acyl-homoserine-lactone synthase [Kordiimonas aquimaris]|uniref:acyl-homoserine-lactone synthase n=1 Tax=Kordiimonas aquimaris TaxID=707591 RepID=UPI0021CEECF4|nr:acyl-homoserine-lactone synthase [Kordiimonas aquimaris]